MLLCSRPRRDYFPILRDPSRSSLTSRDASRFFSLLSPYVSLSFYYLSYADYNYLISPFHSHCYLSLALYVFLSFSSLCSFLRSHRRDKRKTNTIGDPNDTTAVYRHPLQRTIATRTHGKRQEFVSFPWSQEDRRRGPKPPVHSLLN